MPLPQAMGIGSFASKNATMPGRENIPWTPSQPKKTAYIAHKRIRKTTERLSGNNDVRKFNRMFLQTWWQSDKRLCSCGQYLETNNHKTFVAAVYGLLEFSMLVIMIALLTKRTTRNAENVIAAIRKLPAVCRVPISELYCASRTNKGKLSIIPEAAAIKYRRSDTFLYRMRPSSAFEIADRKQKSSMPNSEKIDIKNHETSRISETASMKGEHTV